MQALSRHRRTFAYDLWGFGDTSKVPDKYSFDAYLDLIHQFVDTLGIARPFTLVGHGLGAALALRYARLKPRDIEKLTLVALPIDGRMINSQLTNGDPITFVNRHIFKSQTFSELEVEIGKIDPLALSESAKHLSFYNFADDFASSEVPMLLIHGERDQVVRLQEEQGESMVSVISPRQIIKLDGCNHFPMLEEPAVFNRLLKDYILTLDDEPIKPKYYWQRRTR